jgi:hypothetical protein
MYKKLGLSLMLAFFAMGPLSCAHKHNCSCDHDKKTEGECDHEGGCSKDHDHKADKADAKKK